MSEQKSPKKKRDTVTLVLTLLLAAAIVILVIVIGQYYRLTKSMMEVNKKLYVMESTAETEQTEKELLTEEEHSEKQTETVKETTVQEYEEETGENISESSSHEVSKPRDSDISPGEAQPQERETTVKEDRFSEREAQPVEQRASLQETSDAPTEPPSGPTYQSPPVPASQEHTASELTIADIPNSLYAQFENPEELRNTLFQWLLSQGINALECTCDYDYTDDGQYLYFTLHFNGFSVTATYSPAGNAYSYGIAE